MGRTSKRKLMSSRLSSLTAYLLQLQYQPKRKVGELKLAVKGRREEIKVLLEENPNLKKEIEQSFERAYDVAITKATWGTGISEADLPSTCPFDLQTVLNNKFFPKI